MESMLGVKDWLRPRPNMTSGGAWNSTMIELVREGMALPERR